MIQAIEERAIATYQQTLPIWLCYVDDTFTIVYQDEINTFHEHLNEHNPDIHFTKKIEENGKILTTNEIKSWYTNSEREPLNRAEPTITCTNYKRLIHDLKRNQQTSTNNRRIESNSNKTTDKSQQR